MERCEVNSSTLILCRSPMVDSSISRSKVTVEFLMDNLRFDFSSLNPQSFTYEPNPVLRRLNQQDPMKAYRYNPGSFIQLEVREELITNKQLKKSSNSILSCPSSSIVLFICKSDRLFESKNKPNKNKWFSGGTELHSVSCFSLSCALSVSGVRGAPVCLKLKANRPVMVHAMFHLFVNVHTFLTCAYLTY